AVLDEAPAPPPKDRPWPQWLGPTRDGVTSYPGLLTAWPGSGQRGGHKKVLKWEAPGGDGYSSFAVGGGRVLTQVALAGGGEAVICFDAETGQEKWRHTHRPGRTYQFPGPLATPALDGGRLYAVGSAGLLLCLKADSGEVLWEFDLRDQFKARD